MQTLPNAEMTLTGQLDRSRKKIVGNWIRELGADRVVAGEELGLIV
jgi:hypothetical protein